MNLAQRAKEIVEAEYGTGYSPGSAASRLERRLLAAFEDFAREIENGKTPHGPETWQGRDRSESFA